MTKNRKDGIASTKIIGIALREFNSPYLISERATWTLFSCADFDFIFED